MVWHLKAVIANVEFEMSIINIVIYFYLFCNLFFTVFILHAYPMQ